jgi:exopolyphosphatase/guanosine-5'-triphosphate,3'-diphosphate pyrophosphatase
MSRTLATLDIGSNSIHLLILRVEADLHFRTIDRMKEMVRLGESVFRHGHLTEPVIRGATEAVLRMQRLARLKKADPLLAVATAAVREASNGGEFLHRLLEDHGLRVRVITGDEEARLIYLAARLAATLDKKPALFIDIGGGSVELTVGTRERSLASRSLKLGVLRLKPLLGKKDPPAAKGVARLRKAVAAELRPLAREWRRHKLQSAVLSAGTCEVTDHLAWPDVPPGIPRAAAGVAALARTLEKLSPRRREALPGHEPRRADIIVPGALLLGEIFRAFKVRNYQVSDWGLREGIALDYLEKRRKVLAATSRIDDVRRRSVVELSRFAGDYLAHSRHTALLALQLFDRLKSGHRLGPDSRERLEYAALLHDIGHHIHAERHHKHTYYLITNSPLKGFTPEEIRLLALVARYHRRSLPGEKDPEYAALPGPEQRMVTVLSALLRMADALDRSHNQLVRDLAARRQKGKLTLTLRSSQDIQLELWAAHQQAYALAEGLDFKTVEIRRAGRAKKRA